MKSPKLYWLPLFVSLSLSAQTFTVLHSFTNTPDGAWPQGGLALNGGTLYGATQSGGSSYDGTLFELGTNGVVYSMMRSFTGNHDGSLPEAGLMANNGVIYGTTSSGGTNSYGTVFKMNVDGTGYQILANFGANPNQSNGAQPYAKVTLDGGWLYGTVSGGGSSNYGGVFKVGTDGTGFSLLKSFYLNDGWNPQAGVAAYNGTLYGSTAQGSTNGNGEIFKINEDGTGFAVIHAFNGSDGSFPRGDLIVNNGVIYGLTYNGGYGSVFKLNTDGTGFQTLKSFNGSNGGSPEGGLVLNGNSLYGTTSQYGQGDYGNVFKINLDGSGFFVLHSFTSGDGQNPVGDLVLANGVLYGVTFHGGSASDGVVYSLVVPPPPSIVIDSRFGVHSNAFGFTITGPSNLAVAVDSCSNLNTLNWTPLQTNTLGTNSLYFKDTSWTNRSVRFYRIREP